jgi:hypothetical protein
VGWGHLYSISTLDTSFSACGYLDRLCPERGGNASWSV